MGTPEYACPSLKKLHESHEIVMVYTQPDRPSGRGYQLSAPPVKQMALELGLPVHQPNSLKSQEEVEFLKSLQPDAVIVVAYGLMLPKEILEIPPMGCINAHGSILPKYRGASPMQQAILDGESHTGVTTMLMNEGMDTGAILLTHKIELGEKTISSLHDELAEVSANLLLVTLFQMAHGEIEPMAQDDSLASYTSKISRADSIVDWTKSSEEIVRRWRAFYPWPGLTTTLGDKSLKLIEIERLEGTSGQPGTVMNVSNQGIDIATGDGLVRVKQIQPAGKRAMSVSDYLRGHSLAKGIQLGV